MNLERQIIIDWLVARPDNEAHPELTTLVMRAMKAEKYNDAVHKRVLAAGDEFDMAVTLGPGSLREYYNKLEPEALIQCFDNWCCHQYR